MSQLVPFYDHIKEHYDLSNDFFSLFLDATMTYSCAYFEHKGATLKEAQLAKLDKLLDKADIKPGRRLLDIGFGWGSLVRRAAEEREANVVGLTLSAKQHEFVSQQLSTVPPKRGAAEVRLQGWEEFHEPVDRIISIEVFEHFRRERYDAFFERCRQILPDDGRLVLQTSVWYEWAKLEKWGIPLTHEDVMFGKFIRRYIFPGGQLCDPDEILQRASRAGFNTLDVESLNQHYPPTLDRWAANLEANCEKAIEYTSQETYDNFMHYLTGCAARFRSGHIGVYQYTFG